MRFIGNKENLLDFIDAGITISGIKSGTFCDFFSGTANVGKYYKNKGFTIISSDLLYFSYILQYAYIKNNKSPQFRRLLRIIKDNYLPSQLFVEPLDRVIHYLNALEGKEGFIYQNYTEKGTKNNSYIRKYFSPKNGKKIDSIRQEVEKWKLKGLINASEYYILLACLIESVPYYANISGVYGAFLKKYDPRALKKFKLKPIQLVKNGHNHKVYNQDSMTLLDNLKTDILYIDPPYNERQYAPNYHLLETIARYDNPVIKGVTGMREYSDQKSDFCNKYKALKALDEIAKKANYVLLALSYNSEGIMPTKKILETLGKYGRVELIEANYRRFKSNNNGDSKYKKDIKEQLYLLERTS